MNTKNSEKKAASIKASRNRKSASSRVKNPVIQMTANGRRIRKFNSICDASIQTGVNTGSISKVVRGICNTAGGFRWANA